MFVFFFFFSSRSRHTSFDCDWSSDVCSSALLAKRIALGPPLGPELVGFGQPGWLGQAAGDRGFKHRRIPSRQKGVVPAYFRTVVPSRCAINEKWSVCLSSRSERAIRSEEHTSE